MQATQPAVLELAAPEHLALESRTIFRQSAVDSAGLGALMLIQRKASERRQVVVLKRPNDELRFLLVLTKLDDLFEVEADAA